MTPGLPAAPLHVQRQLWEVAAEAVEKADVGADRLTTLLTAEVGHTDSEIVYEENKLELHHYEPEEKRHETPIFIVYALVNRPYILDLQPDRSVIQRLLAAGFEVYMIDWGEPSTLDRSLRMEDYVCRYMRNCMDAVQDHAGVDQAHLLGYCMGGSMSIMFGQRYPEEVRTLGLMATPLAFSGEGGILERWASHYDPDPAVDALGNMPAELLAFEFSMMDPVEHYLTKYVHLYENIEDEDFVANFARMEQWIWDGVDIAGEAYREFLNDIYKDNQLIDSEFVLDGEVVDLAAIELPVLQIVGEYDHIVPPASSKPFHDEISSEDDRLIEFPAGHIGISVSSAAHEKLWPEVTDWFAERSGPRDSDEAAAGEPGTTADSDAESDAAASSATDAADAAADSAAATETVQAVAEKAAESLSDGGVPAAAEAPGDDSGSESTSRPVSDIDGIGPTYAERLRAAGVETVPDLASTDVEQLAAISEAPAGRVEGWLDQVE